MPHPRVIEGTTEEIAALLQESVLAGRRIRLIIDPEPEELEDDLPIPPDANLEESQLVAMLLEGIASPKAEMTDREWEDIRNEVREHLAKKKR